MTFRSRMMLVTAAASFAAAQSAAGQTTAAPGTATRIDERWRPYFGCWISQGGVVNGAGVCVVPTADPNVVEFTTVQGDSVLSVMPVSASGQQVTRTRDGCTGWERGVWSADERRLYLSAEFRCGDAAPQTSSGMLGLNDASAFTRIDAVKTRNSGAVRVINFAAARDSLRIPASIRLRLPSLMTMATYSARIEAASAVRVSDVAEAARNVEPTVVEAWLVDRGQRFALDARGLRELKAANVAPRVIDMMVAVTYPETFAVAVGGEPEMRPNERPRNDGRALDGDYIVVPAALGYDVFSPFGFGFGYGWRNAMLNPFFNTSYLGYGNLYSPFGYGYGSGYYGGVGGGGLWLPGTGPFVIVPGATRPSTNGGRAINGTGYSRGSGSDDSRGATPRGGGSPSPSVNSGGGNSGGGGNTSGGGSSAGGASAGGGGRTAKPRP